MDRTPAKPPIAGQSPDAGQGPRSRPLWQAVGAALIGGVLAFALHPAAGPVLARDAAISVRLIQLADATAAMLTGAGFDVPRRRVEDFTAGLSSRDQGYTD